MNDYKSDTEIWIKLTEIESAVKHSNDSLSKDFSEFKGVLNERDRINKQEAKEQKVAMYKLDSRIAKLERLRTAGYAIWVAAGVLFVAISYTLDLFGKVKSLL